MKYQIIIFICCSIFTSCGSSLKEKITETKDDKILNTASDSTLIYKSLKDGLQGNWSNVSPNDDRNFKSFEVKGDTLFGVFKKDIFKIIIKRDSTLTLSEILSKQDSKTIKPRFGSFMKINKLTEDSLVSWKLDYGSKKYLRYYKKR